MDAVFFAASEMIGLQNVRVKTSSIKINVHFYVAIVLLCVARRGGTIAIFLALGAVIDVMWHLGMCQKRKQVGNSVKQAGDTSASFCRVQVLWSL